MTDQESLAPNDRGRVVMPSIPNIAEAERNGRLTDKGRIEQFVSASLEVGAIAHAAESMGLLLSGQHPIRALAVDLRSMLHSFIHHNIGPASQIGFNNQRREAVGIKVLQESCFTACDRLEEFYNDPGDGSAPTVSLRTFAHRLQTSLEGFLVYLAGQCNPAGLPSSARSEVVEAVVQLKAEIANSIQGMDGLAARCRDVLSQAYAQFEDDAEENED